MTPASSNLSCGVFRLRFVGLSSTLVTMGIAFGSATEPCSGISKTSSKETSPASSNVLCEVFRLRFFDLVSTLATTGSAFGSVTAKRMKKLQQN